MSLANDGEIQGEHFPDADEGAVKAARQQPDNDPTEYLPVMRHHLHEALWVINLAQGYVEAGDLAASYRDALTIPKSSPLARSLDRSHTTLAAYLGLLDDEEDGDEQEPVSEDE